MSWERWWRRRSPFERIFEEMERMMRELDEMFSRSFEELEREIPRSLIREKRTDRGYIREIGPIVYGYSITIGPDGKPIVREFGNIRPGRGPEIVEVSEPEKNLLRRMAYLPILLEEFHSSMLIKPIADYAYTLASEFNIFYEKVPVLRAEGGERAFRLAIVKAFTIVFSIVLDLLGVPRLGVM